MKVLMKSFDKPGLWLQEQPKPHCAANEVLIKVFNTAICGTDLHIYQWDDWARKTIPVPLVTGHEFFGKVEALGDGVTGLSVGQRVSAEGHIACGRCSPCMQEKAHLCRETVGIGVTSTGCFAEWIVVPSSNVVPLPENISPQVAACLDPLGNAVHTTLAFDLVGQNVLITGAGPIGIMAVAVARKVGAQHVVITDVNPYRLALAEKMGASAAVNVRETALKDVSQSLGITHYGIGLEMSGQTAAFNELIKFVDHGGDIALLGILPNDTLIDWHAVIFKGITLKGIYGRKMYKTWHQMLALLDSGLDITPVITHSFSANDFEKGFALMQTGQCGKVILNW